MSTPIQGTNLRAKQDSQSNPSQASRELQENAPASTKFTSRKELDHATVLSTALSQLSRTTGNKVPNEKKIDQSDDDYNGIESIITGLENSNHPERQAIQRVRAAIIDTEAESSANATTLMLLMIGIMAGFQRANMTAAVSTLQSIVAKIKTRIDKMTTDKDAAFSRDMWNFGADMILNVASLGVTTASVSKIQPLRKELIHEQQTLAKCYEYESLKAATSAVANNEADASGKLKSPRPLHTPDELNVMQARMKEISNEFPSAGVPASYAVKSGIDILQTRIASLETWGQFFNSAATALKGGLAIAVAIYNKDAATAKITAEEAEMEKAQLDIFMRQFIEQNSIFRDTIGKFLNEAEQMQNLQSSNSTAITHRISN